MKRRQRKGRVMVDTRGCVLRDGVAVDINFYLHPSWSRIRQLHGVLWLERNGKVVPIGIEPFAAPVNICSEQDCNTQSEYWKTQPTMLQVLIRPIEEPRGMEVVVRLHLPNGIIETRGRAFRSCGCDRGHGDREAFFEILPEQSVAAG